MVYYFYARNPVRQNLKKSEKNLKMTFSTRFNNIKFM